MEGVGCWVQGTGLRVQNEATKKHKQRQIKSRSSSMCHPNPCLEFLGKAFNQYWAFEYMKGGFNRILSGRA